MEPASLAGVARTDSDVRPDEKSPACRDSGSDTAGGPITGVPDDGSTDPESSSEPELPSRRELCEIVSDLAERVERQEDRIDALETTVEEQRDRIEDLEDWTDRTDETIRTLVADLNAIPIDPDDADQSDPPDRGTESSGPDPASSPLDFFLNCQQFHVDRYLSANRARAVEIVRRHEEFGRRKRSVSTYAGRSGADGSVVFTGRQNGGGRRVHVVSDAGDVSLRSIRRTAGIQIQ